MLKIQKNKTKTKQNKTKPADQHTSSRIFLIAVDLKEIRHFLHVINHATRYSAAALVKSKKEDIAETIMKIWIVIFGDPRVIL